MTQPGESDSDGVRVRGELVIVPAPLDTAVSVTLAAEEGIAGVVEISILIEDTTEWRLRLGPDGAAFLAGTLAACAGVRR